MNSICILTDSLIQFPSPIFDGRELIYFSDFHLVNHNNKVLTSEVIRAYDFPLTLFNKESFKTTPHLQSPSAEDVAIKLENLSLKYDHILCLSSSRKLTSFYKVCKKAVEISGLQSKTILIDSQSISLGQGILCQKLVEMILEDLDINSILQKIRQESKNIYGIFYIQNFSYLYRSGLLPHSSALLGEMHQTKHTFILENGTFFPTEKAKSVKNIVDIFENYACEFEDIHIMSILQSKPAMSKITQQFKERLEISLPSIKSSEQIITPFVSSLLGPKTTGIFFYEPLFF